MVEQKQARARTHHPLVIRAWVVGKHPRDIFDKLAARIDLVSELLEPYGEGIARTFHGLDLALEHFAVQTKLVPQVIPLSPSRVRKHTLRLAWELLVRYCHEHPYKGKFLPRIVTTGFPWEVFPDEIHFLDLDRELVRKSFRQAPMVQALKMFSQTNIPTSSIPAVSDAIVGAALAEIYYGRAAAWENPFVQWVVYELLKTVHNSSDATERREARDRLVAVFDAFLPDLSEHISRREEDLLEELQAYQELCQRLKPLHISLAAHGPTAALLAQARDRLDPRLALRDLCKWKGHPLRDIALTILAEARGVTSKTVAERLTLARKAQRIQEAWTKFREYYPGIPEEQQLPLLPRSASLFEPSSSANPVS